VDGRNGTKLDADLLTPMEIELLMRQCSRRAPTGVRNRALVAILWRCGLRIGEALALAPKDFDPDSGTLVVQRGKGNRRRVVGVDAGTVALVGRWLEVRRKRCALAPGSPLFCSLAGRPIVIYGLMPHLHGLRVRLLNRDRSPRSPQLRAGTGPSKPFESGKMHKDTTRPGGSAPS
jgi:integrase